MSIKIAHVGDCHWRGALNRHKEYRQVFETFFDSCKHNGVTHIFIAGDLVHQKTQGISPELIEQLSWWFTEMAKVAEVHMILGNHDFSGANLSRQDAITPIVEALSNPRIFLYKYSGVYSFAPGHNFCVYSLFDQNNWSKVKPVPGEYNIACYHGPVYGAVTESDWEIEDEMKVDFFKDQGYDLVLLGDIHRMQFLDYREVDEE